MRNTGQIVLELKQKQGFHKVIKTTYIFNKIGFHDILVRMPDLQLSKSANRKTKKVI